MSVVRLLGAVLGIGDRNVFCRGVANQNAISLALDCSALQTHVLLRLMQRDHDRTS
jgi:hypothetical protein